MYIAPSLAVAQQDRQALLFERLPDGTVRVYQQGDDLPVVASSPAVEEMQASFPASSPNFAGPPVVGGVSAGVRVLRADRTGSKNSTAAIQSFIDSCIADGCDGYIPAGTYKITPGQLVFTCGATATAFPTIYTDGPYKTTLIADPSSSADAPFIQVRSSVAHKFWMGGGLGGLGFSDTINASYQYRHGISVGGWWAPSFGHLYGKNLNGAVLHVPTKGDAVAGGAYNPDPWSVAILKAPAVEANYCSRAILNENGVGFTSYEIGIIRAVRCRDGVFCGLGTSGTISAVSAGDCYGWVLEDNSHMSGSLNKLVVNNAEIDNCQYGIRVGNCVGVSGTNIRFVHRRNFGPNTNAGYWPRIAVSLAETLSGNAPSVRDLKLEICHRIEAGGTKADLGVFATGNANGNIWNVTIEKRLIDNTTEGINGTGIQRSQLYQGFISNCIGVYGYVNAYKVLSIDNNV